MFIIFIKMALPATNCDVKLLTFSIDRILSKDDTSSDPHTSRKYLLPTSSAPYSYTDCYKMCNFFENSTTRSFGQYSQFTAIRDSYGHIFRNSSNIIRPAPLRPIPKECTSTTRSTTQMETTNCRRRSWSRAVFSSLQRKGLEKRFALQKYITKPDRRQLAATLGLTDAQVKVWFQNRRMKWRHLKEDKKISPPNNDACKTNRAINPSESTHNDSNSYLEKECYSDEDVDVESNT